MKNLTDRQKRTVSNILVAVIILSFLALCAENDSMGDTMFAIFKIACICSILVCAHFINRINRTSKLMK